MRTVNPILLIPARLGATRLPNKPLADIHGAPMIVHVWRRACESGLGRVVVAAGEREIAAAVTAAGGEAVLTDPGLATGSDRIASALAQIDPGRKHDSIINLQGDLPTLSPADIRAVMAPFSDPATDIATLVAEITRPEERDDPNVVKAVVAFRGDRRTGHALYFSRARVPSGDGPLYHHIGIYAYRRAALERFVALPPSGLERRERLEQLRALEAGMKIAAVRVDSVPLGVDTEADLARARQILGNANDKHETR
ncbi:MAG: 3-deoxy-manno-octulosonate cytidylyltransferase [Pseudomonadota bacterium]